GDARARVLAGVETMQSFVGVPGAGRLEEEIAQSRRRSPAFLVAQRGAQGLSRDVEASAFVAEDVSPAPRSRGLAGGVAAEHERARAGDSSDARLAGSCAGKSYESVV